MLADDALARRNARVLAGAQALGGASPAIVIALGGLVGHSLSEDKSLATLPVSMLNLGLALGIVPAALVMRRLGRRAGYLIGAGIGVLAGSVAAVGVASQAFALFCVGTLLAGLYGAYVQSYRFAAADAASPALRPRVISWVMAGGLVAGVLGPQTVIWTRDLVPGAPFAGGFLGLAVLALASMLVLSRLRDVPPPPAPDGGRGRPLSAIARQPRFLAAVAAGVVSYGLMSLVMTAAPVAMVGCGHSVTLATLGIQWHVLAMFGPSFFTGRLIGRFGKEAVTASGLALIALAALVGLSGIGVAHFWVALILLGVGWNFGFIGATALVTDCYRPEERARAQALNDVLVFGCVAAASFSSGRLLDAAGWGAVNGIVLPTAAAALALLLWGTRRRGAVPA